MPPTCSHSSTGGPRASPCCGCPPAGRPGWRSELDELSTDYAELQVPPRVAALVRQRLHGLSEAAQRVLSVAAVAGDAEALDAVAELAGLSAWATAAAVAEGQAAGLLQGRRFAHDLVHEALLSGTGWW